MPLSTAFVQRPVTNEAAMVCGMDRVFGRCRGDTLEISSHGENTSSAGSERGLDTEASVINSNDAAMLNVVSPLVDAGEQNMNSNNHNNHLDVEKNAAGLIGSQSRVSKRPSLPSPAK